MTKTTTKIADDGDTETVARFVHALLEELSGGKNVDFTEILNTTAQLLKEKSIIPVIATQNGNPVGVMVLNECQAIYAGGKFGEISELYVLSDLRSKGVAALLVNEAATIGHERYWKRLEVGAPHQPRWLRTLDFYLRNGFEEIGPRLRKLI